MRLAIMNMMPRRDTWPHEVWATSHRRPETASRCPPALV